MLCVHVCVFGVTGYDNNLRFLYFTFSALESSSEGIFFSLCKLNGREKNKVNFSLPTQSRLNENGNRADFMSQRTHTWLYF